MVKEDFLLNCLLIFLLVVLSTNLFNELNYYNKTVEESLKLQQEQIEVLKNLEAKIK